MKEIFKSVEDNPDESYYALSARTKLPEWLRAELPDHKPTQAVSYADGNFIVEGLDKVFSTVVEAYDEAEEDDTRQTVLDASLNGHGGELIAGSFFVDIKEGETSSRLLVGFTSESHEELLKHDYGIWLEKTLVEYEEDPADWVKSYNFLKFHPLFWYRAKDEKTFDWGTDEGFNNLMHAVYTHEDELVVRLEHGGHVETTYTSFYLDDRLTVRTKTFEEGYVALAANVHKYYAPDGMERSIEDINSLYGLKLDK